MLKNFSGDETEHKKIKIGDGLCSLAVLRNEIVNEKDVKSNKTYLACFPSTNSEIVVPVRMQGEPIGEIDVDSDTKNAFGVRDESFLSEIADKVADHVKRVASIS
jgi:GAF domain-containing protein